MRGEVLACVCVCGTITGLVQLLLPAGPVGAAGRRALGLCGLMEILRLLCSL